MQLPRIDAVRDSLKLFDIERLSEMQNKIVRQSLNNKLVKKGTIDGYKVVAMDGVELFESTKKSCDNCLKREVKGVRHLYKEMQGMLPYGMLRSIVERCIDYLENNMKMDLIRDEETFNPR